MDKFEYGVISDFLGSNWGKFIEFADEFGLDEAQCEELANEIDKAAGRS